MYFTDTDLLFIFLFIAVERTQERKLEELLLGAARDGETGKLTALVSDLIHNANVTKYDFVICISKAVTLEYYCVMICMMLYW